MDSIEFINLEWKITNKSTNIQMFSIFEKSISFWRRSSNGRSKTFRTRWWIHRLSQNKKINNKYKTISLVYFLNILGIFRHWQKLTLISIIKILLKYLIGNIHLVMIFKKEQKLWQKYIYWKYLTKRKIKWNLNK